MGETIQQLLAVLSGMWQKRWIGLLVAWSAGIAGIVVVLIMPDKYEASARIYVDTQSVLRPLMSGLAVQPNVDQQIGILSRTLISRPNLEKLARMSDLDLTIKEKEDQERLIDGLMKSLEIKSAGRDNLYTLSYRDIKSDRALRVLQALVSIFVESGIGDKRKDSDSALKFIEEQIRTYEKKLEDSEGRLKDFKLKNLSLAEEGKNYFSRINEIMGKLKDARLELREAENARDSIKRELAGEEPILLPEASDNMSLIAVPEIDNRINTLRLSLDNLLQRYTEHHPDVVGTAKLIAQLEQQKRLELQTRKKAGVGQMASPNVNPVVQQLKVALSEAAANVASRSARVAEYQSRFKELGDAARLQPEIEAEYSKMNRDYDILKKSYEGLVSRRESASMAEQMGTTTGVADFRMIDPPRVLPTPVGPNRLVLLPLVLLGSLLAGIGGSFVMSQIRPTFNDSQTLFKVTGLPLLGVITFLKSEASVRLVYHHRLAFFAGLGGLVACYGATLLALSLMTSRNI